MDKNVITGTALMFLLFVGWSWFNQPSKAQLALDKHHADSIATAQKTALAKVTDTATANKTPADAAKTPALQTPTLPQNLEGKLGAFAPAGAGTASNVTLANSKLKLTFNTKGGTITAAEVLGFQRYVPNPAHQGEFTKAPVVLLNSALNKMDYALPLAGTTVHTTDLYFAPTVTGNTATFRAAAGDGKYFEQTYTLSDGYDVSYSVRLVGLNEVLTADKIALNWDNNLAKMEKSADYETTMTTINYKQKDGGTNYIKFGATSTQDENEKPLEWVSHTQQFFNTTLIAKNGFVKGAKLAAEKPEDSKTAASLMALHTQLAIPFGKTADETFAMRMYVGPNDYDLLKAENIDLQHIIPFGWSVFRIVNVYLIRPIFSVLHSFIFSAGIVILLLTLLVKLILYPLSYRMLHSQAKMGVLKPRLAKLKAKFGDDQTGMQAEQMKMYREYGVNPLGGCMPMLVQMPIWLALYRFFPASIEFRQQSFLWADDLSSYDSILNLGFSLPMYGDHISLFAILWSVTTLAYTYYNSKDMDYSANPAMEYMQYATPVIFLVFFNSFASGLACYLVFSNLLNIAQTLITKNYIIDHAKLEREMEAEKANPKKATGFQAKIAEVMAAQQTAQQAAKQPANKKK